MCYDNLPNRFVAGSSDWIKRRGHRYFRLFQKWYWSGQIGRADFEVLTVLAYRHGRDLRRDAEMALNCD